MCSLLDRCAVKKDTFRPLCLVRKVRSLKRDFELPLFQIVFLRSIYFNYIYFNFTPFLLQYAHVYVVIRVYEICGRLYQDKLKLQAHRLLFHLGILGLLNPKTSTFAIHVLKKSGVCVCGWYSNGVPPFFQKDLSNAQFRIQNRSLLVKRKWHLQKPFIRVFTFCRFYNEIIRKQKECALYFSVDSMKLSNTEKRLFYNCCIFTITSICRTLDRKCVNRKYF